MGASSRDRNPASIRHVVGSEAEAAVIAVRIAQRKERARSLVDAMNNEERPE